MDTKRTVKKYGNIYRKILVTGNCPDPDSKQEAYEKRLTAMYASKKYEEHNIYLRAKRTPSIGAFGYHRTDGDEFAPYLLS